MRTRMFVLILAVLVVVAGCAATPRSGVVGWKSGASSIGSYAPDIPFTSTKGKQTTFHKVREPVAIVAFVSPPGEACCWLRPELVELAERFKRLPITVVQISVPTSTCEHGAGCVEVCNIGETDLVSLCDADRIAWKVYNQPSPETVFIIDGDNKIAAVQSINNLDALARQAERMAEVHEDQYELNDNY